MSDVDSQGMINSPVPPVCRSCDGNGYEPGDCSACDGTGYEPAVDTEAAAVWERLTESQRDAVQRADKHGGYVSCHYQTRCALTRREVCEREPGPTAWQPWRLTDLGRRVAAHGKAVQK